MSSLRPITGKGWLYNRIIATGGIGSGIFFQLEGNETLGREESRMAQLLPYRDFCKQHIIMHYLSVLLNAGTNVEVIPIGKVGNDATGQSLIEMMRRVGMDTQYLTVAKDHATLFSVCFLYPDHSGGNITTSGSASNAVMTEDIDLCLNELPPNGEKEIILAVPEVPLAARIRLLEQGKERGSMTVTSIQSAETEDFDALNGFALTDLLFINIDEASKIAGLTQPENIEQVVVTAINVLINKNNSINVWITCGASGVYCYTNQRLEFFPSLGVEVVSTAGAGDAFLAGTLAGICAGLPAIKNTPGEGEILSTATELGILTAALSVTSPHSIHEELNRDLLYEFITRHNLKCSDSFQSIIE